MKLIDHRSPPLRGSLLGDVIHTPFLGGGANDTVVLVQAQSSRASSGFSEAPTRDMHGHSWCELLLYQDASIRFGISVLPYSTRLVHTCNISDVKRDELLIDGS